MFKTSVRGTAGKTCRLHYVLLFYFNTAHSQTAAMALKKKKKKSFNRKRSCTLGQLAGKFMKF